MSKKQQQQQKPQTVEKKVKIFTKTPIEGSIDQQPARFFIEDLAHIDEIVVPFAILFDCEKLKDVPPLPANDIKKLAEMVAASVISERKMVVAPTDPERMIALVLNYLSFIYPTKEQDPNYMIYLNAVKQMLEQQPGEQEKNEGNNDQNKLEEVIPME